LERTNHSSDPFAQSPLLSLVIPCFKDAEHLASNSRTLLSLLEKEDVSFEMIFVNDGSPDNTNEVLEEIRSEFTGAGHNVKVVNHPRNYGRGRAVRTGFEESQGEFCAYMDIDLEPDPKQLGPMLARARRGADIVVGRRLYQQEQFKLIRRLLHWGHRAIVNVLLKLPVRDTHAGIKIFRRETVLPVLRETQDQHWFWDTEILSRAFFRGLSLEEWPVAYKQKASKPTTVRFFRDTMIEISALFRFALKNSKRTQTLFAFSGLLGAAALGAYLRMGYGTHVEYKHDEFLTFDRVRSGPIWNFVGLDTSSGLHHPGLGLSIFVGFSRLFGWQDPGAVSQVTQIFSSAALFMMAGFIWKLRDQMTRPELAAWLWSVPLLAVNPLYLFWERKIWQPSILSPFVVALVYLWWRRKDHVLYAFGWGALGALIGQIHLSAYFLSGGLFIGALLFDSQRSKTHWKSWLVGSSLGAATFLPWLIWAFQQKSEGNSLSLSWHRIFSFRFFNFFLSNPFGWPMRRSFGTDLWQVLRFPLLEGRPLYLAGLAYGVCLAAMVSFFVALWHSRLWLKRILFKATITETNLLFRSVLLGSGLLASISMIAVNRHFLLAFALIPMVFMARVFLRYKKGWLLLAVLVAAQSTLSVAALWRVNQGIKIFGEFGIPTAIESKTDPVVGQ
jgi:glycosyltransferase involved in cell wall biosynthesis